MQLLSEFQADNDEDHKVHDIWDSAIYARESATGQLLKLDYLILWKSYLEEENIWEPTLAI